MSTLLSDYNKSGYVPTLTRDIIYSDFDMAMHTYAANNLKGDIIPLTDIDAIKNSIRNLVLSGKYDRPFQPQLGAGLKSLLFENATAITKIAIKDEIYNVIRKYEPRVSSLNVDVADTSYENAYTVTITFAINNQNPQKVEIIINRLR